MNTVANTRHLHPNNVSLFKDNVSGISRSLPTFDENLLKVHFLFLLWRP